jgi:hypothetical protein
VRTQIYMILSSGVGLEDFQLCLTDLDSALQNQNEIFHMDSLLGHSRIQD